jgi:hypothetical protein
MIIKELTIEVLFIYAFSAHLNMRKWLLEFRLSALLATPAYE